MRYTVYVKERGKWFVGESFDDRDEAEEAAISEDGHTQIRDGNGKVLWDSELAAKSH